VLFAAEPAGKARCQGTRRQPAAVAEPARTARIVLPDPRGADHRETRAGRCGVGTNPAPVRSQQADRGVLHHELPAGQPDAGQETGADGRRVTSALADPPARRLLGQPDAARTGGAGDPAHRAQRSAHGGRAARAHRAFAQGRREILGLESDRPPGGAAPSAGGDRLVSSGRRCTAVRRCRRVEGARRAARTGLGRRPLDDRKNAAGARRAAGVGLLAGPRLPRRRSARRSQRAVRQDRRPARLLRQPGQ
jgi:hypothetical protein